MIYALFLSFIVFVHKVAAHPVLHIAKAGIQVDVLHAFHDIGVYEGAGLSEGADKLLHLLALGAEAGGSRKQPPDSLYPV